MKDEEQRGSRFAWLKSQTKLQVHELEKSGLVRLIPSRWEETNLLIYVAPGEKGIKFMGSRTRLVITVRIIYKY